MDRFSVHPSGDGARARGTFVDALRRRWLLTVVVAACCLGAVALYASLKAPEYQSHVQIFVAAQAAPNDLSAAFQGSEFTTARVQSYVDLVDSPEVTQPVIQKLHLPLTASALSSEITADAPPNTVLLDLTVTDRYPGRAQRIAGAAAAQLIKVVRRLEAPNVGGSDPVRLSVSEPATLPTGPSAPKKKLDILAGILVGIVLGAGAAQVRNRLDTTIRTGAEVSEIFGIPLLGEIPVDSEAGLGLEVLSRPESRHRVEALRTLRTNLHFLAIDHQTQVLVVTSCSPGDGKTTTVSTLGWVIAESDRKVIVVDGDLRRPALHAFMGGLHSAGVPGVIVDDVPIDTALVSVPSSGSLQMLPAGQEVPNPTELLGSAQMASLISDLAERCDVLLIDAPPLLPVTDAAVLATMATGAILIFRPGVTDRRSVSRAIDALSKAGARLLGAVANETKLSSDSYYGYAYAYGDGQTGWMRRRWPIRRRRTTRNSSKLPDIAPGVHETGVPGA